MQIWKNCTADVLYYGEFAVDVDVGIYIIRLSDDSIEVAYDDDGGAVCYRGKNNGDGQRIGNSSAQVNLFPAIFGAQVNLFPAIFVSTRALSHFACVLLSSKRKSGIVLLG